MLKFIALLKSFFEDIFVDIYFGFSTEKEQVILVAFFLFNSGNMSFRKKPIGWFLKSGPINPNLKGLLDLL